MVGYNDPYNRAVTAKMNAKVAAHATQIDRLNGSGKACCASCAAGKKCKCMKGGAANTPIAAKKWFAAEDRTFEDQVHQTLTPQSVRDSRMEKDLGAGKYAMAKGRGAMRGMRGCGNELSSNPNITPPQVARQRAALDLGAGKFQGGSAYDDDEDEYEYEYMEGGAAAEDDDYSYDEDYEDGDDVGELEGGGADEDYEEPETLREMKSICQDYEEHRMTGGAMTKRVRAMLPRGGKSMAVSLSKLLQKLKKRGRASFARRLKRGMMTPSAEGSGRYVGGAKDHGEIERIHDSIFGGSKLSGGNGPVAPTTEALQGYDNQDQGRGLMPPPSVNQQSSMKGGAVPLNGGPAVAKKMRPAVGGMGYGMGYGKGHSSCCGMGQAGSRSSPSHGLIPVAQLPSKIGGGRFSSKGDYIGPSTGAIIPNLQTQGPVGSGSKRASRGAMVAKLMREKGMSLAEASKALKGGAYTANDFFMPRNAHQFFGAYA